MQTIFVTYHALSPHRTVLGSGTEHQTHFNPRIPVRVLDVSTIEKCSRSFEFLVTVAAPRAAPENTSVSKLRNWFFEEVGEFPS